MDGGFPRRDEPLNVLGEPLAPCSDGDLVTGYYRDGSCATGPDDVGLHGVCARVTAEFLEYSLQQGNDLITPHPEFEFPGLKPGDRLIVEGLQKAKPGDKAKAVDWVPAAR